MLLKAINVTVGRSFNPRNTRWFFISPEPVFPQKYFVLGPFGGWSTLVSLESIITSNRTPLEQLVWRNAKMTLTRVVAWSLWWNFVLVRKNPAILMKSCFSERSTRNAGWVNKKVKSVALDGQLLASLRCNVPNTLASSGWPFCFSKAERWSVEGQWDKPRMHFFLKTKCVRKVADHACDKATALHAQWGALTKQ